MSRRIFPCLLSQYPTQQIVFIHSMYFTNVMLDYPKDIKWNQFPYIQETEFKINTIDKWRATTPQNGVLVPVDISMDDIRNCEKIIYMGDPCYHDAYSFSVFFEKVFNTTVETFYVDAVYLVSLAPQDIQHAWNNKGNFYEMFKEAINYGKVARYFDYNFNFNSFALFGKIYKYIDKNFNQKSYIPQNDFGNIFLSKYMLQLLYFVREQEMEGINFTEGRLIQKMYQWKGTGKYNMKVRFGGEASRTSIIENLISLNFFKLALIPGEKQNHIFITEKGNCFLQTLPKDCIDYDLPFRINIWAQSPFNDIKSRVDTYLNNYYKKVKNKIKAMEI